jgi:hypothetical protein
MTWNLVSSTKVAGNGNTPAINTTGATLLVAEVTGTNGSAVAPSDSNSNSWTLIGSGLTSGNGSESRLYYSLAPTVGAGHTFSNSSPFAAMTVAAFSGALSPGALDQNTGFSNTSPGQPGSVTPSQDNELVIAVIGGFLSSGAAIDSSFTLQEEQPAVNGVNYSSALAYKIQTTAIAENPTWTFTGTGVGGMLVATFKAAVVSSSFTASPTSVPKNHSNITLTLSGTGTSWAGGGSQFSVSGVSGTSKVSENVTSATAATLVITTGSTTGTLTISDGTTTTTVSVATASLAISPTSGAVGTTPTITLTGTNTIWTQETAAGLFSVSGGTGASIGTPTITTDTAGTVTLTVGTATGTLTITDNSTGATASFTASGVVSVQSGNWNVGSTWNSGSVPSATDAVTIAAPHVVTIPVGVTITHGDGTDNPFLVCLGKLVIDGGTFVHRGGTYDFGLVGAGLFGAQTERLRIQNNGVTAGNYIADANSGVDPIIRVGDTTLLSIAGSSSALCGFRTKSIAAGDLADSAGNNLTMTTAGGGAYLTIHFDHAAIHKLGTSSTKSLWVTAKGGGNDGILVTNSTIDSFGQITIDISTGDSVMQFNGNRLTNTLVSNVQSTELGSQAPVDKTTGTREVIGNVWGSGAGMFSPFPSGLVCNNNVCLENMSVSNGLGAHGPNFDSCDNNFIRVIATWFNEGGALPGFTNCYWFFDSLPSTMVVSHSYTGISPSGAFDSIFQSNSNVTASVTNVAFAATEGATLDRSFSFSGIITLPNRSYPSKGIVFTQAFHGGTGNATTSISGSHSTFCCPNATPFVAYGIGSGTMGAIQSDQVPNMIPEAKSCIFWRNGTGSGSGVFAVEAQQPSIHSLIVTDEIPASACDYNCHLNLDRVAAGAYSGYSGDTGVEDGTVYAGPMSGSTVPGAHDLIDVDPQFVDVTRCLETWAVSMGSTASTDPGKQSDAFNYLAADPANRIASLLTHVRNGFKVTNPLLNNAGHDGVTIGAMGFQASGGLLLSKRRKAMQC